MNRIGILGGTFDPIHLGHLVPAQFAKEYLNLDRLILVPSATPVHRPRATRASAADRLAMCHLAAATMPGFEVSDLEVSRQEPSYTILTLRHFAKTLPLGTELVLLVGEDNLSTLHTWKEVLEILSLATIAILPRPGANSQDLAALTKAIGGDRTFKILAQRVPGPMLPISATDIRARLSRGESIDGMVPAPVADYIADHNLYSKPKTP
jgi:nicotinate-nucleotide adenylyltransferase